MKQFIFLLCMFSVSILAKAQTIKQAEYFIDVDKGIGKNTKINLASSVDSSYNFHLNLTGVTAGYHKLYLRTKDSQGHWSMAAEKIINVTKTDQPVNIIAAEFFIDVDKGIGKNTKIDLASAEDSNYNFHVNLSGIDIGYHKLYFRTKDTLGNWSNTAERLINITKNEPPLKITAAEYFFTIDKGFGKSTPVKFAISKTDGQFKFKIPYSKIPEGADTLFIRVTDSIGHWSTTNFALFTKQTVQKAEVDKMLDAAIALKQFSVFPNPATQVINFSYPLQVKSATIKIFDVNGKVVLQKITDKKSINISSLAAGLYILQLDDGLQYQTAKFIKQ